jgi:hypothetical protein
MPVPAVAWRGPVPITQPRAPSKALQPRSDAAKAVLVAFRRASTGPSPTAAQPSAEQEGWNYHKAMNTNRLHHF